MSDNTALNAEDMNKFLQQHNWPVDMVIEGQTHESRVLFELIKWQAEQITELRADLERLAEMSGFGGCL